MEDDLTKVVRTRHGPMRILANDQYVSRCLEVFGEYGRAEWDLLAQLVKPGIRIVEAGANLGAFTIPLARACVPGQLLAFEPQPLVHQLLQENLAINGVTNAVAIQAGLGASIGKAALSAPDYSRPGNFGGIALARGTADDAVALLTIDSLDLPNLGLLKVDVEGAELEVLTGAIATVQRCRPTLYLENDRAAQQGALIDAVANLDYRLYWHTPLLADRGNFNGVTEGIFGAPIRSLNMLCIPMERGTQVRDLAEIDPANWRSPIPAH